MGDRMTELKDHDDKVRARQKSRALVMAIVLVAFVVLMYLITIARMSG